MLKIYTWDHEDDKDNDLFAVFNYIHPQRQAWVPNIFIYNLVSFSPLVCLEVINNWTWQIHLWYQTRKKCLFLTNHILQKLAGLWVANSPEKERELFYNQLSHITFMCPMRFNKFPFDRCQNSGCFPKPFFRHKDFYWKFLFSATYARWKLAQRRTIIQEWLSDLGKLWLRTKHIKFSIKKQCNVYFGSRLTYKASGQNPVLDYMISVDELPERYH